MGNQPDHKSEAEGASSLFLVGMACFAIAVLLMVIVLLQLS